MENKQTAVEWFIDQIESKGKAWENASIRKLQISIDVSEYLDLKRQAKAMEREQIQEAYEHGEMDSTAWQFEQERQYDDSSDYFTKKYGNGENS